jgi:hypothetical protein
MRLPQMHWLMDAVSGVLSVGIEGIVSFLSWSLESSFAAVKMKPIWANHPWRSTTGTKRAQ